MLIRSSKMITARSAHLAHQELAGDDPAATPLLDECSRRLVMQGCGEGPAELLGALGAADVGRDDRELFMPQQAGEMLDKERLRLEVGRGTAEGILEGRQIVDVEGHHRVCPARLEEPGHVFGRDRIARLGPPVLAGVAKIRNDRRHPLGAGVLERADKKQQPAQLVVRALLGIAIKRVHYKHILPADLDEAAPAPDGAS